MRKVNASKLSESTIVDIAKNLGWIQVKGEGVPKEYIEEIENMSPRQLFKAWCTWQGLIGWGNSIWGVAEELKKSEIVYRGFTVNDE